VAVIQGAFGRRVARWLVQAAAAAAVGFVGVVALAWWTATPDIGAPSTGDRLARNARSPQWDGAAFTNPLPQVDGAPTELIRKQLSGATHQAPASAPPVVPRRGAEFAELPESGLRVTWLGHSTLLVELDGARLLVDPVWGRRTSPWESIGPERFYAPPLPLEELPPLDAVVISHDHYDHLDLPTVLRLRDQVPRWIVPLGVGAHLEQWGVDPSRVTELDWWQDSEVAGVTVTCTPARHFSGRWVTRFRSTLWAGWAMRGPAHSVFYSGDTALHPTLAEIGARLGPFDLTAMDAGAYDSTWTDVHLGPEQAVMAHQLVRGGALLPVHWGLFDLANHGWTEPMERVLLAARRADVPVLTPRPGGSVELTDVVVVDRWWPDAPFATVDEDPVWSTSVDDLLAD
jgi:L-ascorbate metabolism protein UlaG (beta-lactamase superfamily)